MTPNRISIVSSAILLITGSALLIAGLQACRQAYNPPAITASNSYLVVDGFVNTGHASVSSFRLNRTRNLNDSTTIGVPELHAQFAILGKHGDAYPLADSANDGTYFSAPLSLDTTQQYTISITTSDGRKYSSDGVSCKQSPPIDSLFWSQPSDLTIYAATHDPTGNTRYYRYDYIETWQHNSRLTSPWTVINNQVTPVDSTDETWYCWSTAHSTNVLITTSVALARDLVTAFPLNVIPKGDPRLAIGYSILVRQYALTEDAYNYWNLIEKTSQDVGTLFDLQPTQLTGNIHCLTNPSEPIIGYITASSVTQQRLFIPDSVLNGWVDPVPPECQTSMVPYPFSIFPAYPVTDTTVGPYYFISNGPMVVAPKSCLDCRYQGGTRIKPSFWP
ncbi:MAG TPA: DUF4249 domain-containing protein [Puia sp.]|jgi:hypothetical protein|nr:DUF4249 domain-containing protein [Puia sp.]